MGIRNRVGFVGRSDINSAALTGNYLPAQVLSEACFLIRIVNASDTLVEVSFNGTKDHDVVPNGQTLQISFQNNAQPNDYRSLLAKATTIYLRGVAGVGTIYLSAYFNELL